MIMKYLLRLTLVLALVAVAVPGFATEAPADLTVEQLGALVETPETVELQGGGCLRPNPDPDCICPLVYEPVCGCNGETYSNSCFARCEVRSYTPGACGSTS